jgi:hypothetical protein
MGINYIDLLAIREQVERKADISPDAEKSTLS